MSQPDANIVRSVEPNDRRISLRTRYEQAQQEIGFCKDHVKELEQKLKETHENKAKNIEEEMEIKDSMIVTYQELYEQEKKRSERLEERVSDMEATEAENTVTIADLRTQNRQNKATISTLRGQLAFASRDETTRPRPRRQLNPNRVIKKRGPRALTITPTPEPQRSARRTRFTGNYKV